MYCGDQVEGMMELTPWRKNSQVTAGRVRVGLQNIFFGNVRIRAGGTRNAEYSSLRLGRQPHPKGQFAAIQRISTVQRTIRWEKPTARRMTGKVSNSKFYLIKYINSSENTI
jgi:hypothetical protein